VGGNWKCNGTAASAKALVETLNGAGPIPENVQVVVAVPSVHVPLVLGSLRSDIEVSCRGPNAEANNAGRREFGIRQPERAAA
jgi:triosephosphate isomerase